MTASDPNIATIPELIRHRIRHRREELGATQAEVAEDMRALGFKWTRETVAQAERYDEKAGRPGRLLSYEELLAIGVVLDVPAISLLLPNLGEEAILFGDRETEALTRPLVEALLLGPGGRAPRLVGEWVVAERFFETAAGRPRKVGAMARAKRRAAVTPEMIAAQWTGMSAHLPAGEIELDDFEFAGDDGRLLLVRRSDGAVYAAHPDGGVVRVEFEDGQNARGRETYTLFKAGAEVATPEPLERVFA